MSRSGSHAGRGFRYQDAVGVWLLAKSWSGELPYGVVIPEGKDDYEVRCAEYSALLQVKSRRNHLGSFPVAEAAGFIRSLWDRSEACGAPPGKLILLLEKSIGGGDSVDYRVDEHIELTAILRTDPRWASYSALTRICIVSSPSESAFEAVACAMPCTPFEAQIYCSELLKKVGSIADSNGMVKDGKFQGLTVSDVEEAIRRIEPLLDLSGMEEALQRGYCASVDFLTPLNDPSFYQGVDTRPGHLAAGLVLERPEARSAVIASLESRGAALIKGASGTGKSALMWESASRVRHSIRWFEVKRGDASDAHLLVRLAQALRASPSTPIGFILDDVGRGLNELWDGLIREVSSGSGVLLLGSIREEDLFLLTSRARTAEVRPEADALIAERIWTQLTGQGKTAWAGWREPWARSDGFLLEYTHILTRGDRLKSVLAEQVDRRLREGRDEELAILRAVALAGSAGAILDVSLLANTLSIAHENMTRALRRLVDEHLIAEPVAGHIKGLHQLRSSVLFDLCHACPPAVASNTIIKAIDSVTSESLKALVVYVTLNHSDDAEDLVKNIAARIERDCDPVAAISAFSGLGQAHIEVTLRKWLQETADIGLEPTQVTLAVMFAVSGTDISALPMPDRLQGAVRALRTGSIDDPRLLLISNISKRAIESFIANASSKQLRSLLASLVGSPVPENLHFALKKIAPNFDQLDLPGVADLLSAVQLIDPQTAVAWTKGDTLQHLLNRVPVEIPWAAPVQVDVVPEGRLLRSSIFHVVDSMQKDVHQEVVQLCQILFGIDPTAEMVAVDALAADGLPSGMEGMPIATKRIPRKNSPPPALPEWNKRWTEAAARLVGTESYSTYLEQAWELLVKLIPVLDRVIDSTLRCKVPPPKILEKFGEVHDASRLLTPPRDGISEGEGAEQFGTPIQDVLFNCSAELIRKFTKLPDGHAAFVFWAGDLIKKIEKAEHEPWDLIEKSPHESLLRLRGIIDSLRLLAAESGARTSNPAHLWLAKARKSGVGNALRSVRLSADEMLRTRSVRYVRQVQDDLKAANVKVEIHSRPNWDYPLPWPPLDLLAVVSLDSPLDWQIWLLKKESCLRAAIGESRRVWIVPSIDGVLVSRLTVGGVATLLPLPHAVDDWLDALHLGCLDDIFTREAERVLNLIIELDGLRTFALGAPGRPALEQVVRQNIEQRLLEALVKFEALAAGTPIQLLPRQLSKEVSEGRIALAESIAALTHGQAVPGIEALISIQAALLEEDLTVERRSRA